MLALDLDLWFTVEVDDDAEDHSLIELAGDMLEEILDAKEVERLELSDGFFLIGTFDDALGIEQEEALMTGLDSCFLLAQITGDFSFLLDKVLLEVEFEDDLATSFLVASADLDDNVGSGAAL